MSVAAASLLRRCGGSVSRCYHSFRRSLATQTREIDSRRRQKQQLPWLLLSSPDNPESRYLYDLTGDNRKPVAFNREIHLPQIAGRHLMGSSQGYLFSVDPIGNIDATDPFTGARLPVPTTAALPNMVGVVRDPSTGNLTHYVSNPYLLGGPDPPGIECDLPFGDDPYCLGGSVHASTDFDPRKVHCFSVDDMRRTYFKSTYFNRAILSPSLDTVVVVHRGLVGTESDHLAFSRIGGSSWTALRSPEHCFQDVIFHKGRLHAVDCWGRLSVFGEDLDNPLGPPMRSLNAPLSSEDAILGSSVVESPDGEDLFLVFRVIDYRDATDDYPPRTCYFKVYKFDEASRKWKRVKNIGDIALFLGFNHSMSLSASDYPAGIIKPNCIYFTDEYSAGYMNNDRWHWVGDTGVYSLKDGFRLYELRDGSQQLDWPPPIWFFMPTAR